MGSPAEHPLVGENQATAPGAWRVISDPQRRKNISGNSYALKSCFNRGIKITDSVIQL